MKSAHPLRVMLADDHAVVRMGFRMLVEGGGDMVVCAEADSGEAACRIYPEALPDVLVMDVHWRHGGLKSHSGPSPRCAHIDSLGS